MDAVNIAAIAAGVKQSQTAAAIAAEVVKQAHAQDQAIVSILETAVQSAKSENRSGPPVAGSTGAVDITV